MAHNDNRTKIATGIINISPTNDMPVASNAVKQNRSNNDDTKQQVTNSVVTSTSTQPTTVKSKTNDNVNDASQTTNGKQTTATPKPKITPQTSPPKATTVPQQAPITQRRPFNQNFPSNTGSAFGSGGYSNSHMNNQPQNYPPYNTQHTPPTNLPMDQKVELIKKSFKEVLGREATDRDTNYHKYGVVTEDSMRKKLVLTNEHKDVLKKGREFDQMKENYEKANANSKLYESKIRDHMEEFKKMKIIFNEKNRYINELRAKIQKFNDSLTSSTSLTNQPQNPASPPNKNSSTTNSGHGTGYSVRASEGSLSVQFFEGIKDFLKSLFSF